MVSFGALLGLLDCLGLKTRVERLLLSAIGRSFTSLGSVNIITPHNHSLTAITLLALALTESSRPLANE